MDLDVLPKTALDIVSRSFWEERWGLDNLSVSGGGRFGQWAGVEGARDAKEQ